MPNLGRVCVCGPVWWWCVCARACVCACVRACMHVCAVEGAEARLMSTHRLKD